MADEASITDEPPEAVEQERRELAAALDERVPARKIDENLLIATWNIKSFSDLTERWEVAEKNDPMRNLRGLLAIGEIVRRFDVVAVQEVQGNLKALRHLMKWLGPEWSFIMTDKNEGHQGGWERMAFLYDTRRVQLSGLAGEVVIPVDVDYPIDRQFARSPYAVSFRANDQTFLLVTFHIDAGSDEERNPELETTAEWMADWARDLNDWDHNLILLGDFNTETIGSKGYELLTSTGLMVPDELHGLMRTLSQEPGETKFYDHIAWFAEKDSDAPALSLDYRTGGHVSFDDLVMEDVPESDLQHIVSDHYPLWAEFGAH